MIILKVKDERYLYTVYHLVKAFLPDQKILQFTDPRISADLEIIPEGVKTAGKKGKTFGEKAFFVPADLSIKQSKYLLDRQVYDFFCREMGHGLSWGILTGVRPTKIAMQKAAEGMEREEFVRWFQSDCMVSEEKAYLAYDIALREKKLLDRLDTKNGYSLYISIPFCPSICSYCSFSSGTITQWKDYIEPYLHALEKEIAFIAEKSTHKKLDTIYIGGGTPTTLNEEQLERLLSLLDRHFETAQVLEFTVEAGRPDTMTRDKLMILKNHPVTRLSINPQTMRQATLERVGRHHTVQQVIDTFWLARDMGFDNINMDLIAGLPGETAPDMEDTLRQIGRLGPDNLTVHALAIKRAAKMGQEGMVSMGTDIDRMIASAASAAKDMGLSPYYLYRQKNIAGNFENVGYAKVDKAGIYNILIMEETESIVAAGAAASTKIVLPEPIVQLGRKNLKMTNLIRVENVKNVREYITRIDEMIERKGEWLWGQH